MEKVSTQLFDNIGDFFSKNPKALSGLLAGGGLGLAGGLMAPADDPNDPDDKAGTRVNRRLKHALIGLLAGGAAGGGIGYALSDNGPILGALPEDDVSPEAAAASSIPLRGLYAGIGGAVGRHFDNKARAKAENDFLKLVNNAGGTENLDSISAIKKAIEQDARVLIENPPKDRTTWQKIKDFILRRPNNPSKTRTTAVNQLITAAKRKGIEPRGLVDMAASAGIDMPEEVLKAYQVEAGGRKGDILRRLARNKRALGAAGVGLVLPEIVSPIYNAMAASDAGAPLR